MQPRLLSASDLADYLAVSPATIRRMAKRGELPKPMRLPGIKADRWDRASIDRYLDRLAGRSVYDDPDEILFGGKHEAA